MLITEVTKDILHSAKFQEQHMQMSVNSNEKNVFFFFFSKFWILASTVPPPPSKHYWRKTRFNVLNKSKYCFLHLRLVFALPACSSCVFFVLNACVSQQVASWEMRAEH